MSIIWLLCLRTKKIAQDIYVAEWHELMHFYIKCIKCLAVIVDW